MPIQQAVLGEDVPLTIQYTDPGSDTAIDPDDQGTDGVPDADITIIAPDDSEVVSAAAMTNTGTGAFEYVWDTSTNAVGTGTYEVRVSAEFSAETKISVNTIDLT